MGQNVRADPSTFPIRSGHNSARSTTFSLTPARTRQLVQSGFRSLQNCVQHAGSDFSLVLKSPGQECFKIRLNANQMIFDLLGPLAKLGLILLSDTRGANTLGVHQVHS